MRDVYAIGSHCLSALGMDVTAHWNATMAGQIAVREYIDITVSNLPFWASRLDRDQWDKIPKHEDLSLFERMALYSAREGLQQCKNQIDLSETVFILSTTKGNIELLNDISDVRIGLVNSAERISRTLGLPTKPIVVSQACISGVAALTYGLRLLQGGRYRHVIVTGADRFTRFVWSGFQSFQAICAGPCRPFDAERTGINLGEAAATIVLSVDNEQELMGILHSGASSNDANHISGPSRTGEELALAINAALSEAGITAERIGAISAHGTATLYNDEMESKAFSVAGVSRAPVHSFKGYIGHTLGAAGILESAMLLESIKNSALIPSAGYKSQGTSHPLHITTEPAKAEIDYALKTASGFGGCNAAIVWGRAD